MNSKRVANLNDNLSTVDGNCVVYIMSRDQRVQDNHALLFAQQEALAKDLPLAVVFNLLEKTGVRSREHYQFMIEGLRQVKQDLQNLNIEFVLMIGNPLKNIVDFVEQTKVASVYFDFNPLSGVRAVQKKIAAKVEVSCKVVDAHNIIPLWVLSDKEEFAAYTIRNKVHKNLEEWLTEPPKLKKQLSKIDLSKYSKSWKDTEKVISRLTNNDINIDYKSGEAAAKTKLKSFIKTRLSTYASQRNIPTEDGQSNLSPYLHFGQISAQRIALELIKESDQPPLLFIKGKLASYEGKPTKQDSINALLEELIVRKELADNYCFYNANYDNLAGAKPWAIKTLNQHKGDDREYLYSQDEWEQAKTHDPAWNAAQQEMMQTGKMHGYMRMYWAKKILEWSKDPKEAIEIAVYLNDKYSIDGGDPNGYTGIMWSIAGIHDRAWFEREVFGKIRYMNYGGLKRKFDIEGYVNKWT